MTDDEKQAWRDLLDDYLADDNRYHPVSLTVRNQVGTRYSTSPIVPEGRWPDPDHPTDEDGRCIYDCPEHYET